MSTSDCGTLVVVGPFDSDQVTIDCSFPADGSEVEQGEPVEVNLTITNDNESTATVVYEAGPSGSPPSFETVVPGGSSVTETVEIDTTGLSGVVNIVAAIVGVQEGASGL